MKIKLITVLAFTVFVLSMIGISATDGISPTETKVLSNTLRIEAMEDKIASYKRTPPNQGFMSFADASEVVTATGNPTFDAITNGTNNLFANTSESGLVTVDGDSMVINCNCDVTITGAFSFSGGNTSTYAFRLIKNGVSIADSGFERDMTSTSIGSGSFIYNYTATSGDSFVPSYSERAGTTDATFVSGSMSIIGL